MSSSRASHQAVSCVSTSPLYGIGCGSTTSNALMRSVATMSRRSSPTSYTSRTLPRATRGKGRDVCWIRVIIVSDVQLRGRLADAVAREQRVHVLGEERIHLLGGAAHVPGGVQRLGDLLAREAELGVAHEAFRQVVRAALLDAIRRGLRVAADALVQRLPVPAAAHRPHQDGLGGEEWQ